MKRKTEKKKTPRENKTPLLLRLDPEDVAKLEALAVRVPFASKTALAIEAIRVGLREIEKNPLKLFNEK